MEKLGYYLEVQVDITGQTGTLEKNIQVSSVLDDALTSLRVVEKQVVAVKLAITPYVEKELDIPVAQIELRNLGQGLQAEWMLTEAVSVVLSSKAVRAPLITVDYLKPYVNLDGLTEGTYTVPLELELPSKVLWKEVKELELVVKKQ